MSGDVNWPELPASASWREVPLAERGRAVERACRVVPQLLEAVPERKNDRLRRIDPVPESTRRLLRRLAAGTDG